MSECERGLSKPGGLNMTMMMVYKVRLLTKAKVQNKVGRRTKWMKCMKMGLEGWTMGVDVGGGCGRGCCESCGCWRWMLKISGLLYSSMQKKAQMQMQTQ